MTRSSQLGGLHPRQHGDLCAALDLKGANAVAFLQHGVSRVVVRDVGEGVIAQAVLAHQIEALANAGEHAGASTSTFISPSASMSSLSHSMKVRSFIAPLWIGTSLVEPAFGEHEAADVLRQVAGNLEQPARRGCAAGRAADWRDRTRPRPAGCRASSVAPVAPDRAGEPRGDIFGQAERLADLTDRAARAIVDDGGGDGGAVTTVALVDVLDHFLAPLVLEIDVDVGRLVAVLGQEAREQQLLLDRIDRRDAEQVADQRIGRAGRALAQDRIGEAAGVVHQVPHGEEVVGVVSLCGSGRTPRRASCGSAGEAFGERRPPPPTGRGVRASACGSQPSGTGSCGYS